MLIEVDTKIILFSPFSPAAKRPLANSEFNFRLRPSPGVMVLPLGTPNTPGTRVTLNLIDFVLWNISQQCPQAHLHSGSHQERGWGHRCKGPSQWGQWKGTTVSIQQLEPHQGRRCCTVIMLMLGLISAVRRRAVIRSFSVFFACRVAVIRGVKNLYRCSNDEVCSF